MFVLRQLFRCGAFWQYVWLMFMCSLAYLILAGLARVLLARWSRDGKPVCLRTAAVKDMASTTCAQGPRDLDFTTRLSQSGYSWLLLFRVLAHWFVDGFVVLVACCHVNVIASLPATSLKRCLVQRWWPVCAY